MTNEKLNLMVGFPSTGKTTFIAALYEYLKHSKNVSFSLDCLPDDREYLEQLVESWIRCELVARTISGKYEKVTLSVTTNHKCIQLVIPDLAGETYRQIFLQREIDNDLYTNIRETHGILVFINSTLDDISSHNRHGIQEDNVLGVDSSQFPPFSVEETPLRVQLVDILQMILDANKNVPKVAVIISAWDIVEDNITPNQWVENNITFLYNFLKHNFPEFQCFGISAQGGDYAKKKDELLAIENPIDRIKVYMEDNYSNDITMPLQYLIN